MRYYDYSASGDARGTPFDGAQGRPADPAAASVECPACRGSGKLLLLVSTRPCEKCGGTGKVSLKAGSTPSAGSGRADSTGSTSSPQAGSPEKDPKKAIPEAGGPYDALVARTTENWVPGHWVTTCTYDAHDRLRRQVERFVPDPPVEGDVGTK